MSAGKNVFRNPMNFQALILGFGALLVATTGCGKSDAPDNPVVTPPAPVVNSEAATNDPPGGLELPDGAIPAEMNKSTSPGGSPESSNKKEGIQMPSQAAPSGGDASQSGDEDSMIRFASWEEIRSTATSSGKITVIDFWSLACEPCLKEFPGLVHLHDTLGAKVQCMAVDMDYDGRKNRPPQYYEEDVSTFLASVNASGFPVYISSTPSEDLYAATKLISIPAVMIFDAQGQIVKVFVDAGDSVGFTYERDVIPFIEKLAEST